MEAGEAAIDLEAQDVRFDGREVALRDRPGDQAPAAERPRRHRRDAAARRTRSTRYERERERAGPGDDRAVSATRDWDAASLRPRLGPAGGVGAGGARAAAARGRRDGARRRLRHRPRDKLLLERLPRGPGDRRWTARRRWSSKAREALPASATSCHGRPRRARAARARGRGLLERRLPLDPRPRRALRAPLRRAAARAAGWSRSAAGEGNIDDLRRLGDRIAAERARSRRTSRAGRAPGTSRRPRPRPQRLEPRRLHGRELLAPGVARSRPTSRASTSRRSAWARTSSGCRRALRGRFVDEVLRAHRASRWCSTTSGSTSTRRRPRMSRIVALPGDGIGPEIMAPARELLDALGDFELEEHLVGGASIDAHGTALTDEALDGLPRRRRRPAGRRRRAQVGHHRPGRPASRAGPAGAAQGARAVRQPAAGPPEPGAARRQPAQARAHRGHRPARGARAHRRHLLRRARPPRRRAAFDTCVYSGEEIERIARGGLPLRAHARSRAWTRPTSSRPPACGARRGTRCAERNPGHAARAPAGRQRGHAARLAPRRLRRDPHREHVRRHPQRRGGDAHRLDRDAPERLASAPAGRACSSPCTARRPTSRAPARPTRSPCSDRWR